MPLTTEDVDTDQDGIRLRGGMAATDPRLGRVPQFDDRSRSHPLSAVFDAARYRPRSYTWRTEPHFDQGSEGSCVGHAWAHEAVARPIIVPDIDQPFARWVYKTAQKYDPWAGEAYEGTSVLAGAKVLQQRPPKMSEGRGLMDEYRWIFGDMDELIRTLGYFGPVVLGIDWYCAVPGTLVLTDALEWLPIEKLAPGDTLVGFDEPPPMKTYQRATVVSNEVIVRPAVEVITDRGATVVSGDHLFVLCGTESPRPGIYAKRARSWVRAADLYPGDQVAFAATPWDPDQSWEAGYLAGFFDGEGTLGRYDNLLGFSQMPGGVLDFFCNVLAAKGYEYGVHTNRNTGVRKLYLRGEYAKWRFLGSVRPAKGLQRAERVWLGKGTRRKGSCAVVQVVHPVGRQEVHAIGTDTGTLITDGLLSHNSGMFDVGGDGFIHVTGSVAGGHALLAKGVNLARKAVRLHNSWGTDWGQGGDAWISFTDLQRLLDQGGECCVPVRRRRWG